MKAYRDSLRIQCFRKENIDFTLKQIQSCVLLGDAKTPHRILLVAFFFNAVEKTVIIVFLITVSDKQKHNKIQG